MVSSTESQGSAVPSDDSGWGHDEDAVGDMVRLWYENESIVLADTLPNEEDTIPSVVGHEIHVPRQNNHEPSDDRFVDEIPEIQRLAEHIMATSRPEFRGRASTEDVIEAIFSRLVPNLRSRGFLGTTDEDVVRNFNACSRREVPLVTCDKVPPASTQTSYIRSSPWKMKNRPNYNSTIPLPKYKKDPKKKANRKRKMSRSSDVSIAADCVFAIDSC